MVNNEELLNVLKDIVNKYEEDNSEKLVDDTILDDGNKIKKNCTLEAVYAYQFINAYGNSCLNVILVYDGWNELLQKVAMNGIYYGLDENIGFNICIYTLNINDFDLDENSMLLYKDTMILMDKKGLFASLKDENDSYKKIRTMI